MSTKAARQSIRTSLADEVESRARAALDALQAGDGGEATYQVSEILALAERARREVRS